MTPQLILFALVLIAAVWLIGPDNKPPTINPTT